MMLKNLNTVLTMVLLIEPFNLATAVAQVGGSRRGAGTLLAVFLALIIVGISIRLTSQRRRLKL